ncbi:MAG: MBL fold metallo-hydrolase [Desulfobacterales bacterium]
MHITFYGAVREVTGSLHLLTSGQDRILLDCGLFQGRRKDSNQKNRILPFDPSIITNVILSHAHIDHSGRIPMLTKGGFSGRVVCTRATADASDYLLRDSAHIQESDAGYLNYKAVRSYLSGLKDTRPGKRGSKKVSPEIKKILKKRRHQLDKDKISELINKYDLKGVYPLYTMAEAQQSLAAFDGYPYQHSVSIGENVTCTFYDAGHILGSAMGMIKIGRNDRAYTIGYTGDMGRFGKPIIQDPTLTFSETDRRVDLLIMESTYGNRLHEPIGDLKPQITKILNDTYDRGGSVLIPAFAYGRTQELLYVLHELYDANQVAKLPIYIDSPLATRITRVFGEHPEVYDKETHATFLEKGDNPFALDQIHFVASVEESMALNREERPHIVISASGMCEAGRILHHLRYKIHNPKHTLLLVGYMARHTLGRRIMEQGLAYENKGRRGDPPIMRFLNKDYPLRAHVAKLDGFSAHADRNELLKFLKTSNLQIQKIALVHGEEDQSLSLQAHLRQAGFSVVVPRAGESINIA